MREYLILKPKYRVWGMLLLRYCLIYNPGGYWDLRLELLSYEAWSHTESETVDSIISFKVWSQLSMLKKLWLIYVCGILKSRSIVSNHWTASFRLIGLARKEHHLIIPMCLPVCDSDYTVVVSEWFPCQQWCRYALKVVAVQ